ncbi:hypothetical protein [Sinosporangium album]|uniref:hypothetical protein n=1 Tax=Sinosporangium album TaxID=504805 RepID=UPI00115FFAE9|nr:hypothetical protein [Sinosporangium album]
MNERPDRVSAALSARLQGTRVLIGNEVSETSLSYSNPDGTVTTESTSGVARIRKDGKWIPVDSRLAEVNGVWKPRVAKADVVASTEVVYEFDLATSVATVK